MYSLFKNQGEGMIEVVSPWIYGVEVTLSY